MAKPSARVVINRSKMTEVGLAIGDGMAEVMRTIVETADPPDATPFGEGLVTRGGYLVYQGPNKLAGWGQDGKQPKKPRAFRVAGTTAITAIAGFGFPGRFQEQGTVHHPAQPFLWPTAQAVEPHIPEIMRPATSARLKAIR